MLSIFKQIFTDVHFLGAFLETIILIFVGFILRRKNIIENSGRKLLTTLVWKITVPCFAFNAFMQDFNPVSFKSTISVLLLSVVLYTLLILLGKLIFIRKGKTISTIAALFLAIGQTTLFSMPILNSVYEGRSPEVMLYISSISIIFRVFVYIVGITLISGEKITKENFGPQMKKIFFTPVMIGMFAGILVFVLQPVTPHVQLASGSYSFLRLDKTMPALYITISSLSKMMSPCAMLLIGVILGESDFASAFSDRLAWIIAVLRNVLGPIFVSIVCLILHKTGILIFNEYSLISVIIAFSAPISVSLSVACAQYHKEEQLASRACLISTLLTAVTLPLSFVLAYYILGIL